MNLLKYGSWAIVIKDISMAYKIIESLKKHNYNVVGISEDKYEIDGIDTYESLKDISHNIDVVCIIEDSLETYSILDEMELLDIKNIWFEQGSYNESILKKAKSMNLNIIYDVSLCKELSRY